MFPLPLWLKDAGAVNSYGTVGGGVEDPTDAVGGGDERFVLGNVQKLPVDWIGQVGGPLHFDTAVCEAREKNLNAVLGVGFTKESPPGTAA